MNLFQVSFIANKEKHHKILIINIYSSLIIILIIFDYNPD